MYINIYYYWHYEFEIKKRAARVIVLLAKKHKNVVDLLINDAESYATSLHIDDSSPVSPNSFEVLANLANQYPNIADFFEDILRKEYGLPRWQAIESLYEVDDTKSNDILKRLINGEYGPYPVKGYSLKWDIDPIIEKKGKTFVDMIKS
jgi:hypothetical protein